MIMTQPVYCILNNESIKPFTMFELCCFTDVVLVDNWPLYLGNIVSNSK